MTVYIPIGEQVTPEWLTAVLRQAQVLQEGEVLGVEIKATSAFNSHTCHLILSYSADASPQAPTRLVVKRNAPIDWSVEAGVREVKFYNLIGGLPERLPMIILCYAAAYDEESHASYVLLQDLSETHAAPVTRDQQISIVEGVPHPSYIDAVITSFAQFHAYWWDHPLLGSEVLPVWMLYCDVAHFDAYVQRRTASLHNLIEHERDWFPSELHQLYEQILAWLPTFWQRYLEPRFREHRNLTVIHGDAYFSNMLCPRNQAPGQTYILDWQGPQPYPCATDLVNLCATFWNRQQRLEGQREQKALRLYHQTLQAHGVTSYSWDDLLLDYRLQIIEWLLVALQDSNDGASKDYWWPKMQCLVAAFEDWQCQELLNRK